MLNELKPTADLLKQHGVFDKNWQLTRYEYLTKLPKSVTYRAIIKDGLPQELVELAPENVADWFKYTKGSSSGSCPVFNYKEPFLRKVSGLKTSSSEISPFVLSMPAFSKLLNEIQRADSEAFVSALKKLMAEKEKSKKPRQIIIDRSKSLYNTDFFSELNKNLLKINESNCNAVDAYGIRCNPSEFNERFPWTNIPVLGGIGMRCMDENTPCRFPYGVSGSRTFPVSIKVRRELRGTLEYLVNSGNEKETWVRVQLSEKKRKKAYGIFIAFASDEALQDFCHDDFDGYTSEDFSKKADDFLLAWESHYKAKAGEVFNPQNDEVPRVQLLLLDKKTEKCYFGFSFSDRISAEDYLAALKRHARSIQFLKDTVFGFKRDRTSSWRLIELMHTVFATASTMSRKDLIVPADLHKFFKLFYQNDGHQYLPQIMQRCLANSLPAIQSFALMNNSTKKSDRFYSIRQAEKIAEIGAYLLLRTKTKEDLMDNTLYLFARECNLYDQLHKAYLDSHNCKGQTIPVGSEAFRVALQNPLAANSLLTKRVYLHNFIRSMRHPDVKLVKRVQSIERGLEILADKLQNRELPKSRPTPEDIWHMHLGFLNSRWFDNNTNTNTKGGSNEKAV
jgi:hypothetical protein